VPRALARIVVETVLTLYAARAREESGPEAKSGAVTAVQRTAFDLRLNPHLHMIALDGAWREFARDRRRSARRSGGCSPSLTGGNMLPWSRAFRSASVVTFAAALVASPSSVFTERSRRVLAITKRFVPPVLACLIAVVQGRAAEVSRIELMPLQTVTVTEEQFLTGSRDGRPVTIAVELRLPSTAAARVPAVVLLHGSGGANTRDDRWSRDLNDLGVATLLVDSFTGRGIVSTVADQSQLSELSGIIDA
jgi:hypothetical protein